MFDAQPDPSPCTQATRPGGRKPVVIVLHQEASTPAHIGKWLVRNGYPLDIRKPRFGDPLPDTLDQHAGAVIFGGPMSANDKDDFIRHETAWIDVALREERPFLGVCLGAQMLARNLGADVYFDRGSHAEIGYYEIKPTEAGRGICDWPKKFYQWHREGFGLPDGAQLLAEGGSDCAFENQAFVYGPRAVAVQFHAEITLAQLCRWSGNRQRLLLKGAKPRHLHLQGHRTYAAAVQTWLDDFLGPLFEAELPMARTSKETQPSASINHRSRQEHASAH